MRDQPVKPERLFILGATGRTGRALQAQARERGHSVTAFVRSPEKIGEVSPGVTVRKGDPCDAAELQAAMVGHDVVISALGPPGLGRSTILSDAARATVRAMKGAGVQRLLVASVGMLFDDAGTIGLILRRTILRNIARDSAAMEGILESSGLDWTIARPPRLTNGPLTEGYVTADGRVPSDSRLSMSRADVAAFLLDEAERPAHRHRIVGLSTPLRRTTRLAYWASTLLLTIECLVGGVMGALQMAPFKGILGHLGYPTYTMTILGAWYALAGLAIVAPGLPRLKEWAYAGLVFNYTGAVASHLAVGDGVVALLGPIFFLALAAVSWTLRPTARADLTAPTSPRSPARRATWIRTTGYWLCTLIAASEMIACSMWDLLRIEYVRGIFAHLGYPLYLLFILGVWKLPCGLVLLVPRFPRLKEWAYAGALFNYSGAVVSHMVIGDGPKVWLGPLGFALITLASWALRPDARRFAPTGGPAPAARPVEWIAPMVFAGAMFVVALLTLPKGPSPF